MTSTPRLGYFNTSEVAINYAEYEAERGTSESNFLFIHGITGRSENWHEVIDSIRNGARAIAVDLRGHGRSGYTTDSYRLPDYARDMAALIKGLELAPVIVVGHSLGAMTALQLAASERTLVQAIVLEDPPLFAREIMETVAPERHERFGNNAKLAASGLSLEAMEQQIREADPEASDEDVYESALSLFVTDADALFHVYDGRIDWEPEIESLMRSVQCPVLLQQGNFELGAWMREPDGERAESLLSNCTLELWDDTGHSLHSEHPERFIDQVNRFVAGLTSAANA